MKVERTDFVSVFTRDIARAKRVHDVDAVRAELEANGVEFDGETLETAVCKMAFFRIPTATPFSCTGGTTFDR